MVCNGTSGCPCARTSACPSQASSTPANSPSCTCTSSRCTCSCCRDVVVIGAGVSGLSTAILLTEAGYRVRVIADRLAPNVVSTNAGATWEPVFNESPKLLHWATRSLAKLKEVYNTYGDTTGIRMRQSNRYFPTNVPDPEWVASVPSFTHVPREELPSKHETAALHHGWRWTGPCMDMKYYLPWLQSRFLSLGGCIEVCPPITSLSATDGTPLGCAPVIINCTGLGAGALCADERVVGARGITLLLDAPWITEEYADVDTSVNGKDITYIIPRTDCVVVGGTYDEGNEAMSVSHEEERELLRRAVELVPSLARATVLQRMVGWRPVRRGGVRLESEEVLCNNGERRQVIHNYGHGGSGVTISWGCAEEVVTLVQRLVNPRYNQGKQHHHRM